MTQSQLIVDTHAHLDFDRLKKDLPAILARSQEVGVGHIISIGSGRTDASARDAVSLAERYDWLWATVGVHPHEAKILNPDILAAMEHVAKTNAKVVAIGETGLDYHYDRSPRERQRETFAAFIQLARRVDKPLVVHSREAEADTLDILHSEGAERCGGVIHCFSGSTSFAKKALDLGFYLSFSGIVTFKGVPAIHTVAKEAPLDRILVETDAPYLAPVPHRGKRNEPAFVAHTLRFVANLRGVSFDSLAAATTANARRLFGLGLDGT